MTHSPNSALSLFEYAELIYNDPCQKSLCMDNIVIDLARYKTLLSGVRSGTVRPSRVIGTGYKYPKKAAIEWLNIVIDEHENVVDRLTIHTVIQANYRTIFNMDTHKHITQ